ncbi:MAG TPA: response regulator transcription factor, partial [Verrucomicrobiae bacterium]
MSPTVIENPVHNPSGRQFSRLALVEDQPEIREDLLQLLETFDEFNCVCVCTSGEMALEQIPAAGPDIVLMDIMLPQMSGIECTARLKRLLPDTRILMFTSSDDEELIFPALEAGADGYLLKQVEPATLRTALLDLLKGDVPMTSGIARRVANYFRDRAKLRDQLVQLTPREKELLVLLAKGYSNKEIATQLSLSVETIHGYLKNVYKKMHVHSRTEAVMKFMSRQGE